MNIKKQILEKLDKKFGNKNYYETLKKDYIARTLFFAIFGAIISTGFAIFNGIYGIVLKSIWYGIFAIYYLILALQKILLLLIYSICYKNFKNDKEKLKKEKLKIYLANGMIFIPTTISLSVMIFVFLTTGKPHVTGEILAITIAAYTTYKITMAIINLKRALKEKDEILQTLRNINLIEVVISIVLLTNTLITTFGTLDSDMRILLILLGLFSCLFIISLSIYMISKAIKNLKISKSLPKNFE